VREEESLLVDVRDGRVALGGGIGGTAFDAEAVPSFLEAVLTDEVRSVETFEVGCLLFVASFMGLFKINSAPVSDFRLGAS